MHNVYKQNTNPLYANHNISFAWRAVKFSETVREDTKSFRCWRQTGWASSMTQFLSDCLNNGKHNY